MTRLNAKFYDIAENEVSLNNQGRGTIHRWQNGEKNLGRNQAQSGGTLCSKVLSDCAEDSSGSRGLVPMAQFNKWWVYKCYFKHYALCVYFIALKKRVLVIFCSMRPLVASGEKTKAPPLTEILPFKNKKVQNSNFVFQPFWQPQCEDGVVYRNTSRDFGWSAPGSQKERMKLSKSSSASPCLPCTTETN